VTLSEFFRVEYWIRVRVNTFYQECIGWYTNGNVPICNFELLTHPPHDYLEDCMHLKLIAQA